MAKFWVPVKNRFQSELIKRAHCVPCALSLVNTERSDFHEENKELVTCQCRRVYLYDKQINHYRRAKQEEITEVEE